MSVLLLILAVSTAYMPQVSAQLPQQQKISENLYFIKTIAPIFFGAHSSVSSINDIELMFRKQAPNLHQQVINKVLMTLKCATEYDVDHNNILTIIDYSLPSNEKRLWVFNLNERKLLFHTYVSHGIKSGTLISNYFSNKYNSKASSIGLYQTQKAYYGREGLSLRLDGLDYNFNDNASNRALVMHSGWYVEEQFIKKYGRPGRSWGCPALPLASSQAIINTIKDKSLMVIYYPSDRWFAKSKFLNCTKESTTQIVNQVTLQMPMIAPDDQRDAILFVGHGYKGNRHTESKPVVVIAADVYERIFHKTVPLTRMLRRQINKAEYIALSVQELRHLVDHSKVDPTEKSALSLISFVIPVIKEVRGGYYETQMQVVSLGKIKEIKMNIGSQLNSAAHNFTVYFDGSAAVSLTPSSQFIRWIGL